MIQDVLVNGPVTSVSPLTRMWKVNQVLAGPQADIEVLEGIEGLCPIIVDIVMSLTETGDITIYFGDDGGYGFCDTHVTIHLAAGVPFVWGKTGRTPSGGPGDPVKVSWTAGDLYLNLIGTRDRCVNCEA
jgi:hypothetical protein